MKYKNSILTKKNLSIFCLVLFFIMNNAAIAQNETSFDALIDEIEQIFQDERFSTAHWGVLIKSLDSNKVWYEYNADKLFMPASNEKILTGAASLLNLGPDFRYTTTVTYDGEIVNGNTIKGNIIVKSNGDPTLYTRFFESPLTVFHSWVDSLKSIGITNITGDIIGDDTAFDDDNIGYGWAHNGLDTWYSAQIGALQFNENYVDISIKAPKNINGKTEFIPNVESDYFTIIDDLEISEDTYPKVSVTRPYGSNIITVSGTVVAGWGEFMRSPSIDNPTLFYTTVLKETLIKNGINVDGYARDCDEFADFDTSQTGKTLLFTHYSPPFDEMLALMMKKSQNLYAETFVRTLGWENYGLGSFENGYKVVTKTLSKMGLEKNEYRYMDGSGLSRYNYISPQQIVTILEYMRDQAYWDVWYDSMPIAGVDGTLKRRMKKSKAENNVRAKTGTISNTRAISGYVETADGEMVVFSFLLNAHLRSSRDTEDVTDAVLEAIANFKR